MRLSSGSFDQATSGLDPEGLDGARDLGRQGDAAPPPPREHDPLAKGVASVADAPLGVDHVTRAEPVARGARAVGAVEREHARLDRRQRDPAVDAREALAHPDGLVVARLHEQPALAELERELDAVGEPSLEPLLQDEAVDHHVEVVRLGPIELDLVAQVDHRAVDAGPHEAFAPHALELQLELPLAGPRDGRENAEPRAFGHREHAVDDLLDGLRLDALPAARAMRHANAGVEQAQVVGDLGDGAHRRPRRLRQGALLDGDGGAQALDALDVRASPGCSRNCRA